jgi:hypothetical protein
MIESARQLAALAAECVAVVTALLRLARWLRGRHRREL